MADNIQVINASANTRKIAKNTILLYIRTLFTMVITLYTSRVILSTLGIVDYGIYNVVGGFVSMFAVLSSSLSNAISRFLTFELGHGDKEKLNAIFSTGINIQVAMSFIIVFVCEIVGVWFLNNKMIIPIDRLYAANWVLQFCMLVFCLNLISIPYNAAIIAHEKMNVFAYISMLDVALSLIVVYMLTISPIDKLIAYAFLLFVVKLIIRLIYGIYCKRKFEECTYHVVFDKAILKEMSSFAGWNFFGNTAYLLNTQGVNMLMNIFFGVAVNAARGIASQVDSAVRMFIGNFMTAVNPQITKSYASGDLGYMHMLIFRSSKFSGYLLLYFAIPVILEADAILYFWLKNVPEYTSIFLRMSLINAFFDSIFASALVTAVNATGKIKKYQIIITLSGFSVFPLTWILFKLGAAPYSTYIVYGIVYGILIFVRLYLLKDLIKIKPIYYIKNVILPYLPVASISFILPSGVLFVMSEGFLRLGIVVIVSIIITSLTIFTIGLTSGERVFIKEKILNKFKYLTQK